MSKKIATERHPTDSLTLHASVWGQRRTALLAYALLLLALVIALSGRSWAIVVTRLLSDGSILLAWLLAAGGWGSLLPLPNALPEAHSLRRVTTIAAGMGILSLVQLACGLAGWIRQPVAIGLVVVGIALLAFRARKMAVADVVVSLKVPARSEWLWLAAIPILAMAIVAAFAVPGWLWGDEPHGYDVVEYHLQLPREWYELGRIAPLQHNVFSYFPLGMEMHYLLALQLRGGPWAGMYLAQLMHVATMALAVVAVYAGARTLTTSKLSATLAAVAAASVPWIMLLAPVAYNEGALLLFTTLAAGWVIRCLPVGATPASRSSRSDGTDLSDDKLATAPRRDAGIAATQLSIWCIAGVMAGFACGVKLTAVPLVLLIVPVVAGIVAMARGHRLGRIIAGAGLYIVVAAIVFSPWLIRNYAWTRNPVFPEAQKAFGGAHFSETQSQRWELAHSPTEAQRPVAARLDAAWRQIGSDWRFGGMAIPLAAGGSDLPVPGLLLPAGVVFAALNWRRRVAWALLALLAAWLIFWIGFTHLQGRFFAVAIPIAALAVALARNRLQQIGLGAVTVIQIMLGVWLAGGVFAQRVTPIADAGLLGIDDLSELMPQDMRDALKMYPDAPVALVGDANAFLYQLPTARLRYRTVFDVDVKPGQSTLDAWLGEQTGSPIIVVDPMELNRFARTYHGIDPLPEDLAGPRDRVFVLTPSGAVPRGH